jgi:hypothetical protein
MKLTRTWMLVTVFAVSFAGFASAGTARMDDREHRQHDRIAQGVRSGDLTRAEARRLRRGQRRVHRMEGRAMEDGRVSPRERRRIEEAQDRQSRAIHRLRHNRRAR